MKIIEDIFALILKFRTQLVSHEWQSTDDVNSVSHPSFDKMCAVHKAFEDYTRFLFKGKDHTLSLRSWDVAACFSLILP